MATFLLAVGFISLFFIFMSVRLIFLKKGEFRGTCATQSPFLREQGVKCGCGKEYGTCESAQQKTAAAPIES
ncbi:hypothetical protein SAMN05421823_103302 [Catalinimonas alkaloidigena]|uniref:Membrane or secreted protein n=1 Tax=Catalinimonas alkaloidigena TaxID=1075417 RepID=A0A1G9DZK4_9BACT|nr:hypothetical protein [Catalinimonas alkaloidigena]SDK69307.1 hypothetical protein SAMN05421823_103302 [Catalinimonas alkaloidigena]